MKHRIYPYVLKILMVVLGCFIIALAFDFYLKSNIGGDSMTVFIEGAGITFGQPLGTVVIVVNITLIAFMAIFDYKKVGSGTVIIALSYGLILSFVVKVSPIVESPNLVMSLLYCLCGCTLAAIAITMWLVAKLGYSPLEGVVAIIANKTKKSFTFFKVIVDITLLFTGFLMGGTFLYGTIIASFLVGPLIGIFIKLYNKLTINNSNGILTKIDK